MTTKFINCCVVFLLLFFEVIGQVPDLNFKRYTKKEGLSNNNITSFAQTPDGFLWVGTTDGLNRFGGNEFKVFRHHPKDSSSISDNSITALLVDHKGTLWIGTEHQGLLKYNTENETFERFNHKPYQDNSLSHPYVTSIKEDINNQLWVGTVMGLNLFRPKSNNFKRYFYETSFLIDDKTLTKLDKDHFPPEKLSELTRLKDSLFPNQIVFHNALKGLFDEEEMVVYEKAIYQNSNRQNNASHIRVVAPDSKGNLWLGYDNGGLSYFNPQTNHMASFNDLLASIQLDNQKIGALLLDNDFLWVGFNNGALYKIDVVSHHLSKITLPGNPNSIETLFKDNKENIWIGNHSGVYLKNGNSNNFTSYEINPLNEWNVSTPAVKTIFQDNQGNIWIGIVQGGISQVLKDMPFNTYNTDKYSQIQLSKNCVSSVLEDSKGRIWIGYYTSGIDLWDKNKSVLQHFAFDEKDTSSLGKGTVFSIFEDRKGSIWIGTYEGGLQEYIPASQSFRTYRFDPEDENTISGNDVRSIKEDKKGNLWLAIHGGGLNKFHKASGKVTRYKANYLNWEDALSDDWVYTIEIDKKDDIWIGSVAGLTKFSTDKNEFHTYNTKNSELSHDKVRVLHKDDKGILWIGTENGLNRFDPKNSSFKIITSRDGLMNKSITGITSDVYGELWIATKYSVAKLNQNSNVYSFIASDAFGENEFFAGAFTVGNDGILYFGGFQGLLTLRPNSLKIDNPKIPLILTGISINYDNDSRLLYEVDSNGIRNAKFNHDQNYIRFNYEGVNFDHARQLQYAYRLEGFDRNWNFAKHINEATYSNLPSGNYQFIVKASIGHNHWTTPKVLMNFEIRSPWWKTTWALSIYFMFLFSLIFIYRWLGIRKEKQRSNKKLQQMRLNYKEQIDSLKIKFYEEISKDLEAPFNTIRGTLQKLISKNEEIPPKTRLTYFNLINQNTRRVIRMIKQLTDISTFDSASMQLRVAKYDIVQYCQLLINTFTYRVDKQHMNFLFHTDIDAAEVYFDIDKLEKILYSLISHSISNTPKNGNIKIALKLYRGESTNNLDISETVNDHWQFAKITIEHTGISNLAKKKFGSGSLNEKHILETQYAVALGKQLISVHLGNFNLSFGKNSTLYSISIPVSADAFHPEQIVAAPDISEKIKDLELYATSELLGDFLSEDIWFDEKVIPHQDKSPFMIQLYEIIDTQLKDDTFGPDSLAEYMNLSRSQLYKKVKTLTNLSVSILIRNRRLSKSLGLLLNTEYNISEIAYIVGFNDPGYFTKCFKEMYGKSPSEFIHSK
ncbi:two-component regulator propeller domain-containing protein [Aquimarina sp. MMG016]|uniref:two-component regulator propeller domain-containing protein n=1 Tax=Aquimarina sp. MMG016 TaxID=2822690 RepID=UPI001B3A5378|nr:two-component regulator propeller domain-containing protein [Aquimarina sp. MMG016]MBQ4820416.1 helix-turn-helix domain-containing protein [Aquimarina sp. MMG016]